MTDKVSVTYMSGPHDGKTLYWLQPQDKNVFVLTIGRREGCDIHLTYDTQVSREHARIIYESTLGSFFLEDTGSRNGTFVGDERLADRCAIKPGELFRVGRTWFRIDPSKVKEHYRDNNIEY